MWVRTGFELQIFYRRSKLYKINTKQPGIITQYKPQQDLASCRRILKILVYIAGGRSQLPTPSDAAGSHGLTDKLTTSGSRAGAHSAATSGLCNILPFDTYSRSMCSYHYHKTSNLMATCILLLNSSARLQ